MTKSIRNRTPISYLNAKLLNLRPYHKFHCFCTDNAIAFYNLEITNKFTCISVVRSSARCYRVNVSSFTLQPFDCKIDNLILHTQQEVYDLFKDYIQCNRYISHLPRNNPKRLK